MKFIANIDGQQIVFTLQELILSEVGITCIDCPNFNVAKTTCKDQKIADLCLKPSPLFSDLDLCGWLSTGNIPKIATCYDCKHTCKDRSYNPKICNNWKFQEDNK